MGPQLSTRSPDGLCRASRLVTRNTPIFMDARSLPSLADVDTKSDSPSIPLPGMQKRSAKASQPRGYRLTVLGATEKTQPAVSNLALSSPDTDDEDDEETYPEGGLEAWLVVLGSWLALLSSLGLMNTMATFQAHISTHQLRDFEAGTIGWIFSVYAFLCFVLGIFIGPLCDKYGPRWLILAGTLCLTASLMFLSISQLYWHFIVAFGLFLGVGTSLLWTPSIITIGHFFKERRGLASGIAATAGSVGGIGFPFIFQCLFPRLGWAWSLRFLGFLCLALTLVANFLVKSRLSFAKGARVYPDPRIFRNKAFAWMTAATFLTEFAVFIPLTYISSYALSIGFSQLFSYDVLTILNTGSVVGRALPGYWADRIGAFNANIMSVAATIVVCFGVWLPAGHTTPGIIVFVLMFGFCSGANISQIPVAIGRLCKTRNYGRYYATCYAVVSVAVLIGIPIAGKIVSTASGGYRGLILMTACVYVAALGALLMAKFSVVGWRRPWAVF